MKYRPLPSLERLQELFDYEKETGNLIRKISPSNNVKVGDIVGSLRAYGYIFVWVDNIQYLAHRLIWKLVTGDDPVDFTIDHKDRNRTNNRFNNLRLATCKDQSGNCGQRGYYFNKRMQLWGAAIKINGTQTYLGHFATKELARLAYESAAANVFGEFTETKLENPFGFTNHLVRPWQSYYRGVNWDKKRNKYQARITIDGKQKSLGYFTDLEEARLAVSAAERARDQTNVE